MPAGVVGSKPSAKLHAKSSKLAVSSPTSLLIWEEIGSYNINLAVPVAKIQMLDVKSQVESAPGLQHAKITDTTKSSG